MFLACASGKRQYLVREDMTNMEYIQTYNDSKPWTPYIDELLRTMVNIRNMDAVIIRLLRNSVSAEQWCMIPDSYLMAYNYSSAHGKTTELFNISQWLPCGVLVIQKYLNPTVQESTITIHVNAELHINVTIQELHIESFVTETKDKRLLDLSGRGNYY